MNIVSLEELSYYAHSPGLWQRRRRLKDAGPPQKTGSYWWQLREFLIACCLEELKLQRELEPIDQKDVLDRLMRRGLFEGSVDVLKLRDHCDIVFEKVLRPGRVLGAMPVVCEIGHGVFKATVDLVSVRDNWTVFVDVLPHRTDPDIDTPWYSPVIHQAKHRILRSAEGFSEYYLVRPTRSRRLSIKKFMDDGTSIRQLSMALQYWYSGLQNNISPMYVGRHKLKGKKGVN